MVSFAAFAAPLSLIVPLLSHSTFGLEARAANAASVSAVNAAPAPSPDKQISRSAGFQAHYQNQVWGQVHIEQRVVVRISPQRSSARQNLLARLPQRSITTEFKERKTGSCVPLSGIAGVQTGSGNRLLLFMRDSKIMSVNLEKACRARDFYSGFYVERHDDGKICIDRDKLHSRNGAICEISRLRQLVAVDD